MLQSKNKKDLDNFIKMNGKRIFFYKIYFVKW